MVPDYEIPNRYSDSIESKIIEYPQQFFSVSDFRKVVEDWPHWSFHHNETAGTYTTEDKYRRAELFYRTLGSDLLVMYQKFHFFVTHRSTVSPKENDKFYLLYYITHQNLPVELLENGAPSKLEQGMIAFCSNHAAPVFEYPERHYGEDVQMIISHNFIREYINPDVLGSSTLQNIIYGTDNSFFVMPQAPGPIRRQMKLLINDILLHPSVPMNKLHLLQKTGAILDLFFRMHLAPRNHETNGIAGKSPEKFSFSSTGPNGSRIPSAARYLEAIIHIPFPGLEFLAYKFDLSVSGLKRGFKTVYGTTPLKYYRRKQMEQACHKLRTTRLSVAEIAGQLGFASPGNFIRAFKAEIGTTPGRFRK